MCPVEQPRQARFNDRAAAFKSGPVARGPMPPRAAPLALLAALVIAGCASDAPVATSPDLAPGAKAVALTTALASCENRFGYCVEPSIAAAPDGTLYVSNGLGTSTGVSHDGGATWESIADPPLPTGAAPDLFPNDVFVAVAPDGTLYYSALLTDVRNDPTFTLGGVILGGIQVAASKDGGASWPANTYLALSGTTTTVGADRQWLAFGPDGEVYVSYLHTTSPVLPFAPLPFSPLDVTGDDVRVARSDDGGASFTAFVPVVAAGAHIGGPVAVDPEGNVLVPFFEYGASNRVGIAESSDRGATWSAQTVYEGDDVGAWFPVLSVGPSGRALAWWLGTGSIVVSHRDAASGAWSAPVAWSAPGESGATGPWIAEVGNASWAVAYFTEREADDARVGELVLARGGESGPMTRDTILADITFLGRGANSDFVHFARVNGTFAFPIARAEDGTRVDVAIGGQPTQG